MKRNQDLTPAERAVYDLVECGGLHDSHTSLYRRQLSALVRAGLVTHQGKGWVPVHPTSKATNLPEDIESDEEPEVHSDRETIRPGAIKSTVPPPSHARRQSNYREPQGTLVVQMPQSMLDELDQIDPTNRSAAARMAIRLALSERKIS